MVADSVVMMEVVVFEDVSSAAKCTHCFTPTVCYFAIAESIVVTKSGSEKCFVGIDRADDIAPDSTFVIFGAGIELGVFYVAVFNETVLNVNESDSCGPDVFLYKV